MTLFQGCAVTAIRGVAITRAMTINQSLGPFIINFMFQIRKIHLNQCGEVGGSLFVIHYIPDYFIKIC